MEKYGDIPGAGDCGSGVSRRLLRKGRLPGRKPAANCSQPAVENQAVDGDIDTDIKSVPLVGHCNAFAGGVARVWGRGSRGSMLTHIATLGAWYLAGVCSQDCRRLAAVLTWRALPSER
eukprot:351655-Chlamydomonas_euryale.AAC.3